MGKQSFIDYDIKPIHPGTKHGLKSAMSMSWHAGGSDFLIRHYKKAGSDGADRQRKADEMRPFKLSALHCGCVCVCLNGAVRMRVSCRLHV